MNTQHHNSFTKAILSPTQRLFRSKRKSLLASHHIDSHTMRDIGRRKVAIRCDQFERLLWGTEAKGPIGAPCAV